MIAENITVSEKKTENTSIDTIGCTFDKMGKYQFRQPSYECSNCYINNICYKCIDICHKNCRAEGQNAEMQDLASEFICKCGQHFCHQVDIKKGKSSKEPCSMMKIDEILNLRKKFICGQHNVEICSLCVANCHGEYNCKKSLKTINLNEETEGDLGLPLSCMCSHENHSKFYFSTFEDLNYNALDFENKLQSMNTLMKTKVISNKQYTLSMFEKKAYIDDDFLKYLVVFLEIMVNNNYKPHLFIRELRDSFPFTESRQHLSDYKPEGLKQIYIKIYIITLIFFMDVKRDFWKMKVLTFSDFRTNSISFRINYRKYLFDKNNPNPDVKNLQKKYLLYVEETSFSEINTLKGLVLNLIDTLHLQIKEYTAIDFNWFIKTFKFIKFALLNMIFSKGELNLLISTLYDYFKTLNEIFDKKEVKHQNINNLCLPKILYLICVNYNDLVLTENLSKNYSEHMIELINLDKEKVNHFIHYENEHTEKLLKLIILNKKFYSLNYDPYQDKQKVELDKKILDDCLNMFLNFDNIYYEQIRSLKREMKQLNGENLFHIISDNNKNLKLSENSPFINLKIMLEKNIEDFFYYNIQDGNEINIQNYYNNTVNSIKQFVDSFNPENFYNEFMKSQKYSSRTLSDTNINKKILKYQEGLCQKLKKTFPQISFILENRQRLEIFVKLFNESRLDNTITYFFKAFQKLYKNLILKDINIIFDFLSFYLLSKSGFTLLMSGGNLIRIMKIHTLSSKEIVKFISNFIKFSKIYQIDLKNHKVIKLINYNILQIPVLQSEQYIIEKLTERLKIINYLEDSFEYEQYEDLKKGLFLKIMQLKSKINIFEKDNFAPAFEEAEKAFKSKIPSLNQNLQNILQEKNIDNGFDINNLNNNGIPNLDSENDRENLLLLKQNSNSLNNESSKIQGAGKNNKNNESKFEIHSINNELEVKDEIMTTPILSKLDKENGKLLNSPATKDPTPSSSQIDEENEDLEMKKSNHYLMYRFLFAFFKLISKNSFFYYYIYNKNKKIEEDLQKFILPLMEWISEYLLNARTRLMTINKRSILLSMIRTFYFNSHIHSENIDKKLKQLSNEEYISVSLKLDPKLKRLMGNMEGNKYVIQTNYESEIQPKYERLLKFKQIIEIFINELKNLDFIISAYSRRGMFKEKFDEYAYELLISIKHISDFILTEDIWNGIYSSLYDLAEILSIKAYSLKKLLNIYSIKNNAENEINNIRLPYPQLFSSTNKNSGNLSSNKFEKNLIYSTITDIFTQIMGYTDECNNLSVVLENLDKFNLLNFSSYSIGDPERYKHFYKLAKKKKVNNKSNENNLRLVKTVLKPFKSQMADFENSSFLKLIWTKNLDLDIDYEKEMIKYVELEFIKHQVIPRKEVFNKIMLLNYLLFYDTEAVQKKLCFLLDGKEKHPVKKPESKDHDETFEEDEKKAETGEVATGPKPEEKKETTETASAPNDDKKESKGDTVNLPEIFEDNYAFLYFWKKLNRILNKSLTLNYSYSSRIFVRKFDMEVLLLTQEIIHFLQLLSEKQNKFFHKIIFTRFIEDKPSFFELLVDNLISIVNHMKLEFEENIILPYDILIVTFESIINFFIEYLQTADKKYFKIIEDAMENKILKNLSKIMFLNPFINTNELCLNFDSFNVASKKENISNSLISKNISSPRENVVLFVKTKLIKLIIAFTEQKPEKINFISKDFQGIKIYDQIYNNFKNLTDYFIAKNLIPANIYLMSNTKFIEILRFFYKYNKDYRDSLKFDLCLKFFHLSKILVRIYHQQSFKDYLVEIDIDPRKDEGRINPKDPNAKLLLSYKINYVLRQIVVRIDVQMDNKSYPLYFIRPFITYFISNQTRQEFLQIVNRDNAYTKLSSLIQKSDFFIFEMICNSRESKSGFFYTLFFFRMNYSLIEKFNYLIIIAHQILIIYHFYKSPDLKSELYNNFDNSNVTQIPTENFILALIQIVILFLVLVNWSFNKFPQKYEEIMMSKFGRKFVFRNTNSYGEDETSPDYNTIKEIYRNQKLSDSKIVWMINKNIKRIEFAKVILDSVFFNREINVLLFTMIILIIYISSGVPLVLVIPTIFVMNLSATLYDILIALKLRWKQLLAVLLFTYLCIYVFSWIGLLWINRLFNYTDPIDPSNVRKSYNILKIYFRVMLYLRITVLHLFNATYL